MYKVRLTAKTIGVKTPRKPRISMEIFESIEQAKIWIIKHMNEQEKMAWRQIGLVDCKRAENEDGYTMEILPALKLCRGLTLTYKIVNA